ncbi:MAG: carboxypeptidase regulatory-like domain-containing protein [Bacteroidetes bacterium]|nr:carboxypeptidase regulatory-like domain-containing protein [Bacteroidota bacterium]
MKSSNRIKYFFLIFLLILLSNISYSQFPEHYFRIPLTQEVDLNILTKIVSIDNVMSGYVFAYANEEQWIQVNKMKFKIEELPHPSSLYNHEMSSDSPAEWDTYPTYSAYRNMMWQYASAHPDICRLDTIGYSAQNRLLLALKISDNVNQNEDEPEFLYTSSLHGDELVGFVLTLRLAEYLLTQYGQNTAEGIRVTRLVNKLEIWINPLANPDGTYRLGGDTTVNNATRYNANGRDLNRNFPDRISDTNNTLTDREPETQAMMKFASKRNLSLSANFHGGARVVNYPWDNGAPSGQYSICPDDAWFIFTSKAYSVPNPDLMSGGFQNGITNGCQWYAIFGGRQDWIYWWYGGKETTIELWDVKSPQGSTLPQRWNSNKESFLAYMEQALRGIGGIVTDSATAQPVKAKIFIRNIPNSFVRTDSSAGDYHRLLLPGTYSVIFTASGYFTDTVHNITVADSTETRLNHIMRKNLTQIAATGSVIPPEFRLYQNFPNPFNPSTQIQFDVPYSGHVSLVIFDNTGREITSLLNSRLNPGSYEVTWNGTDYASGVYYCRLSSAGFSDTKKIFLLK